MADNFDRAFKFTLGHEGGWGNDPHDRGNWTSGVIGKGVLKGTKFGIAAHAYPHLDIKNLTVAEAKLIYRRDYWAKVAGERLPHGVDLCVWDMGVNAGTKRAVEILRGVIGSSAPSATALAAEAAARPDKVDTIKRYSAARLAFYRGLATFARYGRGWTRRAAECEATAVAWALAATGAPAPAIRDRLKEEKSAANGKAAKSGAGAAGTAGGAGTIAPVDSVDWTPWLAWGAAAAAALILTAFFIHRLRVNRARAAAYDKAAKGF